MHLRQGGGKMHQVTVKIGSQLMKKFESQIEGT